MTLPTYLKCKTNEQACNYIMHNDCPDTCPYVRELGLGAMHQSDVKRISKLEGEVKDGK